MADHFQILFNFLTVLPPVHPKITLCAIDRVKPPLSIAHSPILGCTREIFPITNQ